MKKNGRKLLISGLLIMAIFIIWTALIQIIDVQAVGQNGTDIGFSSLNQQFHKLTGVHMLYYTITDWLALVPTAICMGFALIGFVQFIKRKSLYKVDIDILLLGVYYIIVNVFFWSFELIQINYRPIPIEGRMEASYPSSTTLLVVSVMLPFAFQVSRRVKTPSLRYGLYGCTAVFTLFMIIGRILSGVHWITDIIGAILLSTGLYLLYRGAVDLIEKRGWNSDKNTELT